MQGTVRRPQSQSREPRVRAQSSRGGEELIEICLAPREHNGRKMRRVSFLRSLRSKDTGFEELEPRRVTSAMGDRIERWATEYGVSDVVRTDVETLDQQLAVIVTTTPTVRALLERDPQFEDLHVVDRSVVSSASS